MRNFNFVRTPSLFFGEGVFKAVEEILQKNQFMQILLVTGAGSFMKTAEWRWFSDHLAKRINILDHFQISGEPAPEDVDGITSQMRSRKVDAVISIGGGSVLDTGKAVSAMLKTTHSVRSFLEGVGTLPPPGEKVPFIAVPTTSGTGSEATKNAVLSEVGAQGFKKSLRHEKYIPDFVILDPLLTRNCPPFTTAFTGLDAVTQLIESYVSTEASFLSDSYASSGLVLCGKSFERAVQTGTQDLTARGDMALASYNSGVALANAGLGIVHGLAGTLGGKYKIPHGVACGTLLGEATEMITGKLLDTGDYREAIEKYAQAARFLTGVNSGNKAGDIRIFNETLKGWVDKFKMPGLGYYGVKGEDLPYIAERADLKKTPCALSAEDILHILRKRL